MKKKPQRKIKTIKRIIDRERFQRAKRGRRKNG